MGTQVTLNSGSVDSAGSLLLKTNGTTTAVTLDTAQNMGLGVTPSAWANSKAMDIGGFGSLSTDTLNDANTSLSWNAYATAYNAWKYKNTGSAASKYTQEAGKHYWYNAASGTAGNAITFTQAMTLDANGQLLLGQTSQTNDGQLSITTTGSNNSLITTPWADTKYLTKMYFSSSYFLGMMGNATARELRLVSNSADSNAKITFYTGAAGTASEVARIDSSGTLLVGSTSNTSSAAKLRVYQSDTGNPAFTSEKTTTAVSNHFLWYNPNGAVGAIGTNGSTTYYNTSSDYRLKNSIAPMTGALAKVVALKPVTYKWNADDSDGEGFIAHELAEVCPHAVTGEKDAVDADGNPVYQGIDVSFLVATLTAAIQELNAKVDAQAAEIAALKG
jgi:Chaperone of endosialidase